MHCPYVVSFVTIAERGYSIIQIHLAFLGPAKACSRLTLLIVQFEYRNPEVCSVGDRFKQDLITENRVDMLIQYHPRRLWRQTILSDDRLLRILRIKSPKPLIAFSKMLSEGQEFPVATGLPITSLMDKVIMLLMKPNSIVSEI